MRYNFLQRRLPGGYENRFLCWRKSSNMIKSIQNIAKNVTMMIFWYDMSYFINHIFIFHCLLIGILWVNIHIYIHLIYKVIYIKNIYHTTPPPCKIIELVKAFIADIYARSCLKSWNTIACPHLHKHWHYQHNRFQIQILIRYLICMQINHTTYRNRLIYVPSYTTN